MAEIKQKDGRTVIDYTARDYDSLLRSMRDLIPAKLPEWTDFESEADFGNVLLQLFAHMGDILSYYQDRIANESFLSTAQTRRSIIHHLRLIGYTLATAAPASASLRLIVPGTCNEIITISKGDAFATKSRKDVPSVRFEYTRNTDLTIDCSILPINAAGKKVFDSIPVEEGRLVASEILGESNGTPNQRYTLAHAGLILRSLGQDQGVNQDVILFTQLGGLIESWRLQQGLAFSRANQTDYMIEIDDADRATILFGDGVFGVIPPTGAQIRATYRVGGGTQGNVAANAITTIVAAPQLVLLGAQVTNPKQATGGADRESIQRAVSHAPQVFRSFKRAVTAGDYKELALDFQGVGKVRATAGNWNVVTLFVAPQGGGQVSDVLKANLLAYFEDKRVLSTIVEIEDVDYVKVYVSASVGADSYYAREEIKEKVQAAARRLLAFDSVDFGQIIYLSKFYEAIEAIVGVAFVTITEFRLEAQTIVVEPEGKLILDVHEIPKIPDEPGDELYFKGIRVTVTGGY
jgi:hypothetical protein